MNKKLKPFLIVGAFWFLLFILVAAGFSGSLSGIASITGYAVSEGEKEVATGLQGVLIMVLFFTNLVTLFFLIREIAKP